MILLVVVVRVESMEEVVDQKSVSLLEMLTKHKLTRNPWRPNGHLLLPGISKGSRVMRSPGSGQGSSMINSRNTCDMMCSVSISISIGRVSIILSRCNCEEGQEGEETGDFVHFQVGVWMSIQVN